MRRFHAERDLIDLLDKTADRLATLGVEPVFIGECPNKFNDAFEDDLWFAVQAGEDYWEQSQFFHQDSGIHANERSSYRADRDTAENSPTDIAATRITFLREILKCLQESGWRELIGHGGLIALVIERGQRWLVLEYPNIDDAAIFSWDAEGIFAAGTMERIDQTIGQDKLLTFHTVEFADLDRLRGTARRQFMPELQDKEAETRFWQVLSSALNSILGEAKQLFALVSRNSRGPVHGRQIPSMASVVSIELEGQDGDLVHRRDDTWPKFRPKAGGDPIEYSDLAKAMHGALGGFEKADWRGLFGSAFGEVLERGDQLAIIANQDIAFLIRGNAVFEISPAGLVYEGPTGFLSLLTMEMSLERLLTDRARRLDAGRRLARKSSFTKPPAT